MDLFKLLASPAGRIDRGLFGRTIPGLYAVWWLSPLVLGGLSGLFRAPDLGGVAILFKLVPVLAALQLIVLPYVSACLHLKRLRDAGRGSGTFIAMIVVSLVALPAAAVLHGVYVVTLAPAEAKSPALLTGLFRTLAGAGGAILIAWPLYSLWVGRRPPESRVQGR